MSPSEKDLRASLRHGEGDPVDVERIVAAGAAARAQRRTRLAGVAAAVVLVLAAGSVTGVLLSRDDRGTISADRDGATGSAAESQADGAAIAPGEPTPGSAASSTGSSSLTPSRAAPDDGTFSTTCPSPFPQRALPGGPATGALFDRAAARILVCNYGTDRLTKPVQLAIPAAAVPALQRSLENARSTPGGMSCDAVRPTDRRYLAIIAVDAAGRPMRLVTTTLTVPICDTPTTNGVTVRYGWVPPLTVRRALYALTPIGRPTVPPNRVPSGKNTGSPVR